MPEKERALSVNTVGERERKGEKEKKRERGSSRQSKERTPVKSSNERTPVKSSKERTPVKSSKEDREKERRRSKDKENEEKEKARSSREKVEKRNVIDSGTWDKKTKEKEERKIVREEKEKKQVDSGTYDKNGKREEEDEAGVLRRAPTYVSQGSHASKVVSVRHLQDGEGAPTPVSDKGGLAAFQLVSVESQGRAVVWTVLDTQRDFNTQLGLAHWGQVRMVPSSVINLASLVNNDPNTLGKEVHGYDLAVDPEDGTRLYMGADDGVVIHGSTQADHRPSPRLFKPEIETSAACNSIAFCPFAEPYMLLGSQDGSIRLHHSSNERPLIT